MTKIQLWNEVQELLTQHKANKKLTQSLEDLLKPKSGGGSTTNPPQEIDGVMNYYCRFHDRYEPIDDMVMTKCDKSENGLKSKGYCKASISVWNKTNSNIKKLDSSAASALTDGNFEEAQAFAIEAKELKAKLNAPEFYDYDRDWNDFRS